MFAAIQNDLNMQVVPAGLREKALQVALCLNNIFTTGQTPALGQTVNVRINGKGWHAEGLRHHDRSRFMPHSRERFERDHIGRHLAPILIEQDSRETGYALRLHRRETARSNDCADFLFRNLDHSLRRIRPCEKQWRNLVDPYVGALRREQHCYEQCVGILVIQGHRRIRIKFLQAFPDIGSAFFLRHWAGKKSCFLPTV